MRISGEIWTIDAIRRSPHMVSQTMIQSAEGKLYAVVTQTQLVLDA